MNINNLQQYKIMMKWINTYRNNTHSYYFIEIIKKQNYILNEMICFLTKEK